MSPAESDWLADLSVDDLYERISDVVMNKCPVAIIHTDSSDKSALVLSISTAESGWPRSIVGALKDGSLCCRRPQCCSRGHKLRCEHCKLVANRVTDIEAELDSQDPMAVSAVSEELSAIAAELHGLHLQLSGSQAAVSQPTPTAPSNLPVSRVKIPPDLHSPVMADRVAGKLGGSHANPRAACILLAAGVWYCCMQAVYYRGANHVSRRT